MIFFVGAGPGDPRLITVRGRDLLERADRVIYAGSLVNPELLNWCSESCEIHNSASMTLEEVLAVMEKSQRDGEQLVRLHTGDPSIYGAIKEQIDALKKLGLSYEVIPGVSSFQGAAASLGVEYTLPGVSQTVILTRMEGRTPVPEKENIEHLAKIQASMAIFLSSSMMEELARRLIKGGYPASTKAAIVYKATWPDEQVIHTSLENLAADGKKSGITKTALILVGDFLGTDYDRSLLYHPQFTHEFRQGHD